MQIKPARRIAGRVRLPGDKSISHRAALVAALATGKSHLANFSASQDCASTLSCLEQLGISTKREGTMVQVESSGRFRAPAGPLDCGNSGSTMRMLAGLLAGHNFTSILTGDDSLRSRPMKRIISPLEMMGGCVFSEDGRAPLRIEGQSLLKAIEYELPIASAQVKTCILLAGLRANGRTKVIEKFGLTRDHTERMLQWFGATLDTQPENGSASCTVMGPAGLTGRDVDIPGDFSSATFLIAAAALIPDSELQIEELGLNPTRTQFLKTLRSVGARIEVVETREESNEPRGTIRVRGMKPRDATSEAVPLNISGQLTASLIDELPLVAVIGTQLPGGIVIRDAAELRIKETDRITAAVKNLRAMGADVEEYDDGLAVAGPTRLKPARLDSYGDHRIAMAFSIGALFGTGKSEIAGSDCVAVSFPGFFECLESLVKR